MHLPSISMNATQVYAELTRAFHQVLRRSDVILTPELAPTQLPGWNSFKTIDLILEVETRFGIKLESDDVDALHTVGDLARVIDAKLTVRA